MAGRRTGPGKMVYTTGEEYTGEWRDNLQVNNFILNTCVRSHVHVITPQRLFTSAR